MRHSILVVAFVLCACAHEDRQETPGWPGRLDLAADAGADPEAIGKQFASAVSARYGSGPGAEAVKADLARQGFSCRDVPPVEARTDYLLAECEATKARAGCTDRWTVSLRFDGNSRALDSVRVKPVGSFSRRCGS